MDIKINNLIDKPRRMFANSMDLMDWQDTNCFRCAKYCPEESDRDKVKCELEYDLALACLGNPEPEMQRFIDKGITKERGFVCKDLVYTNNKE